MSNQGQARERVTKQKTAGMEILPVISLLFFMAFYTTSHAIVVGDRVQVVNTGSGGMVVRDVPGGNYIGGVWDGYQGTVLQGPGYSGGYTWWRVDWDNAGTATGWSIENYMQKITVGTPTVSIGTPAGNMTIPNSQTSYGFSGTATAPGSSVAAVEARINGGNWTTVAGTTSWGFTAGSLVVGANVVEVRSRNSQGTYSNTASRTITREAAVGTPTISITSPASNQTIPNGTSS